ncbi:DUF3015 domain-containing protein [Spongiibacter taiwanensis]|uniref:DUF3015 family protein n=1 Tax=Spongiibacter taiwanensis TaxID=1748242 RepID=UPI002035E4CF|nr:DUF3015 family protein [Spongiibacter taiwanensis]USA42420.1 DUF3015 domain-containing protein [Spongiibacter taiwanensis]
MVNFGKALLSLTAAATFFATLSTAVNAEAEQAAGSGPNPYVDCGIGAALFPNTHWAAISSNVIWDLGSTALTSATASPETCNAKTVATAQFILETFDQLSEQTAAGQGEHVATVLSLYGCNGDESVIVPRLRASVAEKIASPAYSQKSLIEKSADYYSSLSTAAQGSCSA